MKRAKVAELKNHLSRYLDYVRAGACVLVLDREEPIARIVPLDEDRVGAVGGRLARLERRGLVRRGSGGLPEWLSKRRPVRLRGNVLADLLAERGEGW